MKNSHSKNAAIVRYAAPLFGVLMIAATLVGLLVPLVAVAAVRALRLRTA